MKSKLYTGHKRVIRKYLKDHEKELSTNFKEGGEITKEFMEILGFDIKEWVFRGAFTPIKCSNKYHCVKKFSNKMFLAFDIKFDTGEFQAQYSCQSNKFEKRAKGHNILHTVWNGSLRCPGEIVNIINEICLVGDSNYMKIMYD